MRWAYKTIHYGLKKDGLLGGSFLDEEEVEESLNDYGNSGWELISLLEVRDGVIAVFKKPVDVTEVDVPIMQNEAVPEPDPELAEKKEVEQSVKKDEKPVIKRTVMMDDTPKPDYIIENESTQEKDEGRNAGSIKIE